MTAARVETIQLDEGRDPTGVEGAREVEGGSVGLEPNGRDAQHALRDQVVGEILDHCQRLRVSPVQILEHEQAALPSGQDAQEPHDSLGEVDHRVVGPGGTLRPPFGNQACERRSKGLELPAGGNARCPHRGAQGFDERPVGDRAGAGHRAAADHGHAARPSGGLGRARQPRLADARFADQERGTADARVFARSSASHMTSISASRPTRCDESTALAAPPEGTPVMPP